MRHKNDFLSNFSGGPETGSRVFVSCDWSVEYDNQQLENVEISFLSLAVHAWVFRRRTLFTLRVQPRSMI